MERIVSPAVTPITYAASGVAAFAGLTATEWQAVGVIGALVLGVLTYGTNLYFKFKAERRARGK